MRAVYYEKYGPPSVFRIVDIPKPSITDDEVLVKIICTTVNRTDIAMTSAAVFISRIFTGLNKPKRNVPGTDFAGIIEEVGAKVTKYQKGEEVFGFNDQILSSQAEYMKIKADGPLTLKPTNVSFEQAAASIEGAHYALNMCRKINVKKNDLIMVNGASGAIGSAAVQLLKHYGAKVVATATSASLERIRNLGADKVINYLETDFTKTRDRFDHILDTVGKSSFSASKKVLKPKGIYVSSELGRNGANIWWSLVSNFKTGKKVKFPFPIDVGKSLSIVRELLEAEQYSPLIDRSFKLEEVIEAYEYVASGKKTGNVILKI